MTKNAASVSYKKSSFGPAFCFVSKRRREALADFYEFCRRMDDIADEPNQPNPLAQLAFWREEINRVYDGKAQTDLGKKLALHVKAFAIARTVFLELIEGMEQDVNGKIYRNWDELAAYIYRVAVVVGQGTLAILGVNGPQADQLALQLGTAVQLTNIIRDIGDDAALKRVYLPEDLLAQYGLSRREILQNEPGPKLAALLAALAQRAHRYYEQAEQTMRQFPAIKMLPCRMMACVYGANLAKIEKTGFLFSAPVKLTKAEKLKGVLYVILQTVKS